MNAVTRDPFGLGLALACLGFLCAGLAAGCTAAEQAGSDWAPAEAPLVTRWADDVSPELPHPEYPRPLMVRQEWLNLNGLWDYAVVDGPDAPVDAAVAAAEPPDESATPAMWDGRILVPFPIESALSGVGDTVGPARSLWYRRHFRIPDEWAGRSFLLHFEAADWQTTVWVNGIELGTHRGGYDPFSFDITDAAAAVQPGQSHELIVSVWDPTNAGTQARGKQVREPGGIFYTSVTGIWQTVWLEPVADTSIQSLSITTDVRAGQVRVKAQTAGEAVGDRLEIDVLAAGSVIARGIGAVGSEVAIEIPEPRLWWPDDPHLYGLRVRLGRDQATLDEVESYFGMREIAVGPDGQGITRLLLNGRFVFHNGPLDQGYWPDGLYTAPTEEAMVYDLQMLKTMGFNMLRKHVKVEPRTFYAWTDRLGLLVWQDMPNANIPLAEELEDTATDPEATAQFEAELVRVVEALRNHPSIVMWVPFNEGWGQYDSGRIVDLVRVSDPTRLVNHASGWHDRGVGDVVDWHSYPAPRPPDPEPERAAVQGEFGGLGFNMPGHMWEEEGWGYAVFPDREALTGRFEEHYGTIREAVRRGLSAAVYTQTTDIETENNGLLTYDREVAKIEPAAVALANRGIFPPRLKLRAPIFVDTALVELLAPSPGVQIRYTIDGSEPTTTSAVYEGPIPLSETRTVRARAFWPTGEQSRTASFSFEPVEPRPALSASARERPVDAALEQGLTVERFDLTSRPANLEEVRFENPVETMTASRVGLELASRAGREELFALRFRGLLSVPVTGVYVLHLTSDDGSRLYVDGSALVDNDGTHGARERSGYVALEAGWHRLEIMFFQGRGGLALGLEIEGPGLERQELPVAWLAH